LFKYYKESLGVVAVKKEENILEMKMEFGEGYI